jgi:pimeloyl-[acyl-carrier protein] methyl ester esterase
MTALVLLPGMDGTGELFAPLIECLPARIEPIVVHYPDRPANYSDHEKVARLELPRDRPFVILGESFSGPVAVSIAAAAPPHLLGMILCVSFLTRPNPLLRLFRPLTPIASPKLVPRFLAHHTLVGRYATPELKAAHARALSHVSSPTLTARLRAMADVDVREKMRRVAVPSLYLRATVDRMVAARFGDEFIAHAPDGRVHDVDAPHFLLQTRPEESARLIGEFVDGLNDRNAS